MGFESLEDFQRGTGQEKHAVILDYDDFVALEEPDGESLPRRTAGTYRVYTPDGRDFRLRPDSPAVDAGVPLSTINDD